MSARPGSFDPVRVIRRTAETEFEVVVRPRARRGKSLPLPNRLLSHFLDHFCKASGVEVEPRRTSWPGSWRLDHVLCEDLGQLVGKGIAGIHAALRATSGVAGRGRASCVMDDALVEVTLSLEGRPRAEWALEGVGDVDGLVDGWYDDHDRLAGFATGTNLRQFVDGFAHGAGATVQVTARRAGNLHHFYEALFRALGDAVREALGLTCGRLPGDGSGLAGECSYDVAPESTEDEAHRA